MQEGYKWSGVHKKENWGHRNNLDNSNFPDDEHVENYRVCVQSCFHGDLESELEDDVVQQVDKVFTEIPTENKENLQRISDSSVEIRDWLYTVHCDSSFTIVHVSPTFGFWVYR